MKGYQAHESFWADAKMYFNLILRALLIGLVFQIVILYFGFDSIGTSANKIYIKRTNIKLPSSVAYNYILGIDILGSGIKVEPEMRRYANNYEKLPLNIYRKLADRLTNNTYKKIKEKLGSWIWISFLGYTGSIIYLWIFLFKSKKMEDEEFVRGVEITPLEEMNIKLFEEAKKNPLSKLHIGETIIPFEMESRHILVLGTSGSGKSVLLNQFVEQINERKFKSMTNERCIFYDLKGEFVAKQFNSKLDYIFSPFDERSIQWRFFNEIETYPDFDVISKSLYLADNQQNEYWFNCAKDVFRTGLIYLKMHNRITNRDIWEFFSQTNEEILFALNTLPLKERNAIKHINKEDSNTSSSIISIIQERIQFFKYLVDMDGDFSFRKFVREYVSVSEDKYKPHPNLFILNIDKYKNIFKPLMSLAIDTLIQETLSLPDKLDRRIFFIIDELGSLYKMESVIDLLTIGRSKGACLMCASQDLGRIEEAYGKPNSKTLFNNFNTNIVFRIKEPETSDFLSKAIGERQVIKRVESRSMSPSDVGDRKSVSDQEKTERLILATEFQELNKLEAILNISEFGVSKIKVPKVFFKERYPNFVMKKFSEDFLKKEDKTEESDIFVLNDNENNFINDNQKQEEKPTSAGDIFDLLG